MKHLDVINSISIVVLFIAFGYALFQDHSVTTKQTAYITDFSKNTLTNIEGLQIQLDSVNTKLDKLAEASLYLDSCQQVRTQKSDRAERRGKFVGGLLKGLFPSL
jgi:hypothetical protein